MSVQEGGKDCYCTLLLSDSYLPGALVLAHSLRDAGTRKELAVLITPDTVSPQAIAELQTVYDHVIHVERLRNSRPDNLQLMNRTDLHSTFTKIHLWNQTQWRRIVYIDSDVVAYRAPDELFDLPHAFAAAPDIGWPDLFNTGVMVLTPNVGDYYALCAMAERNISFDGADQGLLNVHFRNNWHRISFAYNVTPSGHYQYVPAYRHFQSSINMVHFIGSDKPWFQGRYASFGGGPFDEMTGRWWAVYDRHYRGTSNESNVLNGSSFGFVQKLTKGEGNSINGSQTSSSSWDASRNPPPKDAAGEAMNLPGSVYAMSQDTSQFGSRGRYSPPPAPIFPWEANRPKASRVFADDPPHVPHTPYMHPTPRVVQEKSHVEPYVEEERPEPSEPSTPTGQNRPYPAPRTWSESSVTETSSIDLKSEPTTPTTPTINVSSSDPWTSFSRTNAWDDVPEIERYVDALQKYRRTRSIKSPGTIKIPSPGEIGREKPGHKLTDFPSEVERPSLPVTPAPIRRPKFWGGGGPGIDDGDDDNPSLPAAEGVPPQNEWVCSHGYLWTPGDCLCELANFLLHVKDPVAQLQKLARQQSEVLLQKLGSGDRDSSDLPPRPVPFGSEELTSPTYASHTARVLSPQPVKGSESSSALRGMLSDTDSPPRSPTQSVMTESTLIHEPSYGGPGLAYEKGEDFPTHGYQTLPTELD
ncbi:nucleotide-diphospho-sugar transferase [Biscogniauxia mediterranea]|nr:nucleotide-diphospho-sugar transferase [Biscogniauxia mediterranea]